MQSRIEPCTSHSQQSVHQSDDMLAAVFVDEAVQHFRLLGQVPHGFLKMSRFFFEARLAA